MLCESWYLYWKSPPKAQIPAQKEGGRDFSMIEKGHQNLGGEGFEMLEGVDYFTNFGKTRREHLRVPNIPIAQELQG